MQSAQQSALDLPTHRVSGDFRDGLQARIASGEGAPDAAYRHPELIGTRVRYALTGAAAAALLLFVLDMGRPGEAIDAVDTPSTTDIADADTADTNVDAQVDGLQPRGTWQIDSRAPDATSTPVASWVPANETNLAHAGAVNCAQSARVLRSRLNSIPQGRLASEWPQVQPAVSDLRVAVGVMRWLEDKQIVSLPEEIERELHDADQWLDRVFEERSWDDRRHALQQLSELRVDRIEQRFMIRCCKPSADLWCEIEELVQRVPGAHRVYAFSFQEPGGAGAVRDVQRWTESNRPQLFIRVSTRPR